MARKILNTTTAVMMSAVFCAAFAGPAQADLFDTDFFSVVNPASVPALGSVSSRTDNFSRSSSSGKLIKVAGETFANNLTWEDSFDQPAEASYVASDTSSDPMLSSDSVSKLNQAMARYKDIVANGGWPEIPEGHNLQIGSRDDRVIVLRQRLAAEGDLKASSQYPYHFDSEVEEAVRSFQVRYGLAANGIVDKITLERMNVPTYVRLGAIQSNLTRLHTQVKGLKGRYVVVNIPAAQIEAVENGQVFSRHLAVVGKIERPTPVLNSKISQINFNPYWHVPKSIARRDLIPLIRKDISYLSKNDIRIYDNWGGVEIDPETIDWETITENDIVFRQDPGNNNAMASVKINFSNKHAVFLHDTPSKSLFGKYIRTYSSGCVRVERVHDLVDWLIDGQEGINRGQINQITFNVERKDVNLKRPVPLKMVYMTAWAKSNGMVHFRDDIYQLDQADLAAIVKAE